MKNLREQLNAPVFGPIIASLFVLSAIVSASLAWHIASQDEMVQAWFKGNTSLTSYQFGQFFQSHPNSTTVTANTQAH